MANIIPQTADNNQGVWEHLESYCRDRARQGNELLIICGPAGFTGDHIGPVRIPSHTWKIIVEVPNGPGSVLSRINANTRIIAVDIPNVQGVRNEPWQKYVVSVNKIEALTGFHFFTALTPDLAAVLKAKVDGHGSDTVAYTKTASQSDTASTQQPLWIPAAIVVLAIALVLCIVGLILFFRTRRK